jgi:hypothetical protein
VKTQHRSILLTDYMNQVAPTDRLPADDLQPILLGLFGEVGSIMATAKKFHREKTHMRAIVMRSKKNLATHYGISRRYVAG